MEKALFTLGFGRAVSAICQVLAFGLIGRHLGPEGLGLVNTARTVWQIGSGPTCGSVDTYIIRRIAEDKESAQGLTAKSINLKICIAASYVTIIVLVSLLRKDYNWAMILLVTSGCIFGPAISLSGVLQGLKQFSGISKSVALESVALLVFILVAVCFDMGTVVVAVVIGLSSLIGGGITHYMLKKSWSCSAKICPENKINCSQIIWLSIYQIAVSVYSVYDLVIVEKVCGAHQAGIFSAAQRILALGITLQTMVVQVILPELMISAQSRGSLEKRQSNSVITKVILVAVLVLICYLYLSEPFILIVYGESFGDSAKVIKVLSFALFLVFGQSVIVPKILAKHQDKKMAIVCLTAAVLSVILNYHYASVHGPIGVSCVRVLIEIYVLVCLVIVNKTARL